MEKFKFTLECADRSLLQVAAYILVVTSLGKLLVDSYFVSLNLKNLIYSVMFYGGVILYFVISVVVCAFLTKDIIKRHFRNVPENWMKPLMISSILPSMIFAFWATVIPAMIMDSQYSKEPLSEVRDAGSNISTSK